MSSSSLRLLRSWAVVIFAFFTATCWPRQAALYTVLCPPEDSWSSRGERSPFGSARGMAACLPTLAACTQQVQLRT